jgi:hypothetical protein
VMKQGRRLGCQQNPHGPRIWWPRGEGCLGGKVSDDAKEKMGASLGFSLGLHLPLGESSGARRDGLGG